MIDINKKYKTREGNDVRILCTDFKDERYPVIAIVVDNDKSERVISCTQEGIYSKYISNSEYDLIEVREEPREGDVWKHKVSGHFIHIKEITRRRDDIESIYHIVASDNCKFKSDSKTSVGRQVLRKDFLLKNYDLEEEWKKYGI